MSLFAAVLRRHRAAWLLAALVLLAVAALGCIPKRGAYPIEIFSEMHHSQAFRSQEPPRLDAVTGAQVFVPLATDASLDVPAKSQRPYTPEVAGELFRINCSVCHGPNGEGDGPIVPYLTDPKSYYADKAGKPYVAPPNLKETRDRLNEDAVFTIVSGGIVVMPRFELLVSEEERWDIVRYIFDRENGLGP